MVRANARRPLKRDMYRNLAEFSTVRKVAGRIFRGVIVIYRGKVHRCADNYSIRRVYDFPRRSHVDMCSSKQRYSATEPFAGRAIRTDPSSAITS